MLPPSTAARDFKAWWTTAARRAGLGHGAINPTTTQPVELLRAGMPFVKIELLRDNPRSIPLEPVILELEKSSWDSSLVEFDRPVKPRGLSLAQLARLSRGANRD